MINQFIAEFTSEKIAYMTVGRQFCQCSFELQEMQKKISLSAFNAGLLLGEMRQGNFVPAPALLDWIAERTEKKVIVNKKTEWLFLCGRDIFGEGIVESKTTRGIVLIENEEKEVLGYGYIIGNIENKKRVVLQNKFDKGDFLRRERNEKKKK